MSIEELREEIKRITNGQEAFGLLDIFISLSSEALATINMSTGIPLEKIIKEFEGELTRLSLAFVDILKNEIH